ncbi:hypothetical protein [Azospirillum largimobile]
MEQRLALWERNFLRKPFGLAPDVDLARLAREHEIAGGAIINILRFACIRAMVRKSPELSQHR